MAQGVPCVLELWLSTGAREGKLDYTPPFSARSLASLLPNKTSQQKRKQHSNTTITQPDVTDTPFTPRLADCMICSKESGFRQQQGRKRETRYFLGSYMADLLPGSAGRLHAPFFLPFPGLAGHIQATVHVSLKVEEEADLPVTVSIIAPRAPRTRLT